MAKISSTDLDVYPIALGGNVFGWTANEKDSFAVLDGYAAAGGNFIDTADLYSAWAPGNSGGESETILGRWMASRGRRDQTIVATKVGKHPQFQGLSAKTILAAADNSLSRLGTEYIDLYYAHADAKDWPDTLPSNNIIT
jgi:aryl-alcohol dehydrogenase-like predicted oxidoreductase